jgi:hypothetical protein
MAIAEPISSAMALVPSRTIGVQQLRRGPVADALRRASMPQQQPSTARGRSPRGRRRIARPVHITAPALPASASYGSLPTAAPSKATRRAPCRIRAARTAGYAHLQNPRLRGTYVAAAAPRGRLPARVPAAGRAPVQGLAHASMPSSARTALNFYKGLRNDGSSTAAFVATYNIPPIGQPITLHVTMPAVRVRRRGRRVDARRSILRTGSPRNPGSARSHTDHARSTPVVSLRPQP